MPYEVKHFNDGFRVVSDKGTVLSKKPMSRSNANKQLIAVSMKNELCGSGLQPPEKNFYLASKQSYNIDNTADKMIDNLKLVLETPTVKAYLDENDKTMLLAIRGTKPSIQEDINADSLIPFNTLKFSSRYKKDKQIVNKLLEQYPTNVYDYYLTGHSLGGAIVAELKREIPALKSAVIYNSASQPYDYLNQQADQIKRIYTKDDPLYNLGSRVFENKQVIDALNTTLSKTGTFLDKGLTSLYDSIRPSNFIKGHELKNFASLYGLGYPHLNTDNYALHAIIFKKPIDKNSMIQQIGHYIHKKSIPFIRETNTSYRVRNIPKTKFVKSSFRTKKINPKVSLVYGELS
jgi:hypothetical protein